MPYKLIAASLVIAPVIVYTLMNCFRRHVDFKGQHIFITGGSQGIGLSLAQLFLLKGANVTIVARTKSKLDEVVRQLDSTKETQRLTGRIQAIAADVTSLQQVTCADAAYCMPNHKNLDLKQLISACSGLWMNSNS